MSVEAGSVQIAFSNQLACYYGGQPVEATVTLHLPHVLSVIGVRVVVKGYAKVHWVEYHHTQHGTQRVDYRNYETYCEQEIVLYGRNPKESKETVDMGPGRQTFNFKHVLPDGIPCSVEVEHARVRYYVKAYVDTPSSKNRLISKAPFSVISLLDLNTLPEARKKGGVSKEKNLCCLCCKSSPLSATLHLPRSGYVPGECLEVYAEVENLTGRAVDKTSVELLQGAELIGLTCCDQCSKKKTVWKTMGRIDQGAIRPGGSFQYNGEKMLLGAVPPSYLNGCSFINIFYRLKMTVDPSGLSLDLELPLDIIVGNVPLREVVINNPPGPPITMAASAGAPRSNLFGFDGAVEERPKEPLAFPQDCPLPSYKESMFGEQVVSDKEDKKQGLHPIRHSPICITYNFQQ